MVSVPVLTISSCCHKHENWGNYSFEELNHGMAEQFAMISREQGGIVGFIQVSCFGASASSPSRVLRAKVAGEEAVLREMHRGKYLVLVLLWPMLMMHYLGFLK